MIQWMHQLSKSWVASLLMGLLALSFVVWGIADVFTGSTSTSVASVGSTDISSTAFQRNYRNFVRNQSQQMGSEITPDMAQKMGLGETALQTMVSRTALDNEVARLKLVTSDNALRDSVRNDPNFRGASGGFDRNGFLRAIQGAGYSERDYLEESRADQTRAQFTRALEQGFSLPDGYARAVYLYITEKRAADYVIVAPDAVGPVAPPSDAVLAAYVKAHPERFSTPEYRQIDFAQITPADVSGQVTITDAMIAQDYAARESTYHVPEKRTVQQIEFNTEADAKAARARLDTGLTFEKLAEERKIKPADLTLGEMAKSELPDAARADAAFALTQGQISQPVKGAFGGFVLMRVTKITPAVSQSLDQVKDAIRSNLALQLASGKLIDAVNAFVDARSGGADIAEAAKKTGMKFGHFAAIDRNGLTPAGEKPENLPADPEFLDAVFKAEGGEDMDPFPAKSGANYAIKVDGVTLPKLKTLDQVRADALASWTQEQRVAALTRKVAALTEQANKEKSLVNIAKALKVPVQHSPALERNTNDTTFSAALVSKIFDARADAIVMGAQGTGQNFIIAQVTGISHTAPSEADKMYTGGRAQLSAQVASDLTISYANAARERQGVKVNQKLLQSALGSQ